MVQFIEEYREPTIGERFAAGFGNMGQQFGRTVPQFLQEREALSQQKQRSSALGQYLGQDISNIDPALHKELLANKLAGEREINLQKLRGEQEGKKKLGDIQADKKTRAMIEQYAGPEIADLWEASTEGGRTKIMEAFIEAGKRGSSVRDFLNLPNKGSPQDQNQSFMGQEEDLGDQENDLNPPEKKVSKQIDFDKGLTPKERVDRQDQRYNKNLPLFEESQNRRIALEQEKEELQILADLSSQISAFERLNIDPTSGTLLIPALASPEAQRFVKTVNDFTRLAKESYGARVTNFDLTQFMNRLPTLANSAEGREQIIKQMQIINELNESFERNLHNVLDEYGGIRFIDYDRAKDIAFKRWSKETGPLKAEFKKIGNQANKQYETSLVEFKKKVPKGNVAVSKAGGDWGWVPQEKLENFLKKPGNKVL